MDISTFSTVCVAALYYNFVIIVVGGIIALEPFLMPEAPF